MGIEIRLTEQQLPVSPILVDFLYRHLISSDRVNRWHQQLDEDLHNEAQAILRLANEKMPEVARHPVAQQTINRSYDLLMSLLFGATERLRGFQDSMKFILVVGCPRSGGSYLTKHLFQALGRGPEQVPSVIGHDGFPDPEPFRLREKNNAHTTLTRHTAEYIAMAELFFSEDEKHSGRIMAPKKATKAAYYGAFFNHALGAATELIITLRHPVASCISTYEKSGGLPNGDRFIVRSNIESWVARDVEFITGKELQADADYFDSYLHYWENYHYSLVLSGLLANPRHTCVAFGADRITETATGFYQRFGTTPRIDTFRARQKKIPRENWKDRGDEAVKRVAQVWKSAGHDFPVAAILENY